jgi:sigma-B regulation protein RsbU (phosphoserine phosphatase)
MPALSPVPLPPPDAFRAELRADILPGTLGVLLLGLAVAGIAVLALSRRRDIALAAFPLCTGLYGFRLLATSHAAYLLFGVPATASRIAFAVTSHLLLPAFSIFCGALLPVRWRRAVNGMAVATGGFAAVAIVWETVNREPGALARWESAFVLASVLLLLAFIVRPGETPSWELRRLRIAFAVLFVFVAGENLRGIGAIPWPEGIEPIGFTLFLAILGGIVVRRVISNEGRLADVRRELETARRIQQSILPRELPRIPGLGLAVRYLPAEDVAGDFYDFLPGTGRRLGILVADVSGHGVPAALIASMIKVAAAAQEPQADRPGAVLTAMNRIFHGKLRDQFITAAYVHLDLEAGTVSWANAGHPPPLLLRAGTWQELAPTGGILGRLSRADYGERTLPLEPGDALVLFTDGIPETPSPSGDLFGDDRLARWLAVRSGSPPEALAGELIRELDAFSGGAGGSGRAERLRADDLTLVVAQLDPPVVPG